MVTAKIQITDKEQCNTIMDAAFDNKAELAELLETDEDDFDDYDEPDR